MLSVRERIFLCLIGLLTLAGLVELHFILLQIRSDVGQACQHVAGITWVRDSSNCSQYMLCVAGHALGMPPCADGQVWSAEVIKCVEQTSSWNDCPNDRSEKIKVGPQNVAFGQGRLESLTGVPLKSGVPLESGISLEGDVLLESRVSLESSVPLESGASLDSDSLLERGLSLKGSEPSKYISSSALTSTINTQRVPTLNVVQSRQQERSKIKQGKSGTRKDKTKTKQGQSSIRRDKTSESATSRRKPSLSAPNRNKHHTTHSSFVRTEHSTHVPPALSLETHLSNNDTENKQFTNTREVTLKINDTPGKDFGLFPLSPSVSYLKNMNDLGTSPQHMTNVSIIAVQSSTVNGQDKNVLSTGLGPGRSMVNGAIISNSSNNPLRTESTNNIFGTKSTKNSLETEIINKSFGKERINNAFGIESTKNELLTESTNNTFGTESTNNALWKKSTNKPLGTESINTPFGIESTNSIAKKEESILRRDSLLSRKENSSLNITDPSFGHRDSSSDHRDPSFDQRDPNFAHANIITGQNDPGSQQTDPSFQQTDPSFQQADLNIRQRNPNIDLTQNNSNFVRPRPISRQVSLNSIGLDPSPRRNDASRSQEVGEWRPMETDLRNDIDISRQTELRAEHSEPKLRHSFRQGDRSVKSQNLRGGQTDSSSRISDQNKKPTDLNLELEAPQMRPVDNGERQESSDSGRWERTQPVGVKSGGREGNVMFKKGSQDMFETGPQDMFERGPQDMFERGPQDMFVAGPKDLLERGPQEIFFAVPQDMFVTRSRDILEKGPQDMLQSGPQDMFVAGPQDMLVAGPKDLLERGPKAMFVTKPLEMPGLNAVDPVLGADHLNHKHDKSVEQEVASSLANSDREFSEMEVPSVMKRSSQLRQRARKPVQNVHVIGVKSMSNVDLHKLKGGNGVSINDSRELSDHTILITEEMTVRNKTSQPDKMSSQRSASPPSMYAGLIEEFFPSHPCTFIDEPSYLPHPQACHWFYNCSLSPADPKWHSVEPLTSECPYPSLFSLATRTCMSYSEVDCGTRKEYKSPCDYKENTCTLPSCPRCESQLTSCEGMEDGLHPYPGREWTPWYVSCQDERTLQQGKCLEEAPIFSVLAKRCVTSRDVPKSYGGSQDSCQGRPDGQHPDETGICHRYFLCKDELFLSSAYCADGLTFDPDTGSCNGSAKVPPCGPITSTTVSDRFCAGQHDGFYSDLYGRCSLYYECKQRRLRSFLKCPFGSFNPRTHACDQGLEMYAPCGLRPNPCMAKSDGLHTDPSSNCVAVITCRNGYVSRIEPCPDGRVFDSATKKCQLPDLAAPPCGIAPTCLGKPDGKHGSQAKGCQHYYTCVDGVITGYGQCDLAEGGFFFNPDTRTCDFPQNICPPCGTHLSRNCTKV